MQPKKRLGAKGDADEIKRHPFFSGLNWDDMQNLKIIPPFKPKIDSKEDLRHFDKV